MDKQIRDTRKIDLGLRGVDKFVATVIRMLKAYPVFLVIASKLPIKIICGIDLPSEKYRIEAIRR